MEKDEGQFEALMTDNFTFSSAAGDDHISRALSKRNAGIHRPSLSSDPIWSA